MKILTTKQIREADAYTIRHEPIGSADLMERAAKALTRWFIENIGKDSRIKIFAGTGNNGGDGLALARLLHEQGFVPEVYILDIGSGYSDDASLNLKRLENVGIVLRTMASAKDFPHIPPDSLVVDGLFGTGLSRPVTGLPAQLIDHLNSSDADIVAIDIPSGLSGDNDLDITEGSIIRAKYTLTFQFPKLAFFFTENEKFVGTWEVLPIGLHEKFINEVETGYYMTDNELVRPLMKTRDRFSHKGTFGRCLLISGSYGRMGAAVLAATACLRTGTGLLTVHVPSRGCEILQTCLPEAMTSIDSSGTLWTEVPSVDNFDAIGAGPAIGTLEQTQQALYKLLETSTGPLVLDADALNIISMNRQWISLIPEDSIITPHPGEFDRLAGQHKNSHDRLISQIDLAKKNRLVVVLKGAHTSVATPEGTCWFNSSGNPGMATAGAGDVLTGILLSLLGQGYEPVDAAVAGVYLHGVAGDIASSEYSPEAMIAGDICQNLGKAFKLINQ